MADIELLQTDEEFQQIRGQRRFEHDYYFLSQLYVQKWEPLDTI